MSWTSRLVNVFRRSRLDREIDEELASHLEEALEQGRSPQEARRAFGAALRHREASRDIKLLPWLDALAADVVFGWRQLSKHRSASAAAILSLALAIGATTAAFRLVDAVLLRPLPVRDPGGLYYLAHTVFDHDDRADYEEDFDYPTFRQFRDTLANRADLMVAGGGYRRDLVYAGSDLVEQPYGEYVSGNYFEGLGVRPAAGRLIAPGDDVTPGAHPVAVLGYDYWSRRFARDPKVVGRTFRFDSRSYEIIGVAAKGFTGVEPGVLTDIYVPTAMNTKALNERGWSWFHTLVRPRPGVSPEQVRQALQAVFFENNRQSLKTWNAETPQSVLDRYLRQSMLVLPAETGASPLKKNFRRPLAILSILVALVLLIACANVGNLFAAQSAARAREMGLRVSIGAGRARLIQLVLVESAILAAIASAAGVLFSWWSAPLVVSMLAPPDDPVRLVLDPDWRVAAFGMAVTAMVALLFGLAPALHASAVQPMSALRGGSQPHARRGLMHSLIAIQVAFCVLVLFIAGLFVSTLNRLSNRPLGIAPRNLLVLNSSYPDDVEPPREAHAELLERLRRIPGVVSVAMSGWPLLTENRWTLGLRLPGVDQKDRPPFCMDVSPGFFDTMGIGWLAGRDFRPGDRAPGAEGNNQPVSGVGIVNQAFARAYFDGRDPVGKTALMLTGKDRTTTLTIIGWVRDAVYDSVRDPIRPTVYVPAGSRASAVVVRTAVEPMSLAATFRREVALAGHGLQLRAVEPETAFIRRQMIRERLLSTLSLFFAIVALVLAGIGLYGVLNYATVQRRREIGIRMALGAGPAHVVRRITGGIIATVLFGIATGISAGIACGRFVEKLLFEVKATDAAMVAAPIAVLLAAAVLAALPPALRAVQVDPAEVLRE